MYSSPAGGERGEVYVGSYFDNNVYAVRTPTDGTKVWSYTFRQRRVFVTRRGQWDGLCRHNVGQHVRAERHHGRQAMEFRRQRLCDLLARRGERNGLSRRSYNGYVYALNARTGAHLWSFENCCFYPRVQSSPAVSNGVVYFQDDDRIYAFGLN